MIIKFFWKKMLNFWILVLTEVLKGIRIKGD